MDRLARVVADRYRVADQRPTYADGRLIPQPGDSVYQMVAGPFGMGASLQGVVSRNGKNVKVTGGASLMGAIPIGKTVRISPSWTVAGDPSIEAHRQKKEQERAEKEAQKVRNKQRALEAIQELVHRKHLRPVEGPHDVSPGDRVFYISPNEFRDPENPIVEEMQVKEALPKRIENTDQRTYPYTGLYRL